MSEASQRLTEVLASVSGPVAVALSGGADSAVLLGWAARVKGTNEVLALTGISPFVRRRERRAAARWAAAFGVRHIEVHWDPLGIREVAENPPERCYFCKRALYGLLLPIAKACGAYFVLDGTHLDDLKKDRPGIRAIRELGVLIPFVGAGVGKAWIRGEGLEALGARGHFFPEAPCLGARVHYGTPITPERLQRIGRLEELLERAGLNGLRFLDAGDALKISARPVDKGKTLNIIEQIADVAGYKSVVWETEEARALVTGGDTPGSPPAETTIQGGLS